MKIQPILIALLAMLTCNNLAAQNNLNLNAEWYYGDNNGPNTITYRHSILKNGMHNGQSSLVVEYQPAGGQIPVKEINGTVYVHNLALNIWDTLYNINSNIGDTWGLQRSDLPYEHFTVIVTDTFTTTINNHALKALAVDVNYYNFAAFSYKDTVIERLGFKEMFLPYMAGIDYGHTGLRCYEDPLIGSVNFMPNPSLGCNYTGTVVTNITNLQAALDFSIAPNPVANHLNIALTQLPSNTILMIYNSMGQEIMNQTINNTTTAVDVSTLPKGVYTAIIHHNKGSIQQRFIKK